MATIQVRVDDKTKNEAESLFSALGLDVSTAIRMFLSASIDSNGLPFEVRLRQPNIELSEAMDDSRRRRNLHGPYETVDAAMAALLEN